MTTLFAVAEIDAAPVATTTEVTAVRAPVPDLPTCPTPQAYTVPVAEMAYEVA